MTWPQRKKGPKPLRDEARVLCHSQAKEKQHVQGLLAGDLHVVHPPSQGICSLLPFCLLDDEVEVSLVERLSEAALRGTGLGAAGGEEGHLGEAV